MQVSWNQMYLDSEHTEVHFYLYTLTTFVIAIFHLVAL